MIWCGRNYIDEKEVLKIIANIHQEIFPKKLESYFISWRKQIP